MLARTLIGLTALVCLPALAGTKCKTMEQSFDAEGLGHVSIDVHVGELRITPSEDGKIHVLVEACARSGWFGWRKRSADAAALEVKRAEEHMRFVLNNDKFSETWTVSLPAEVAIDADMGVGEISIGGMRSDIDVDVGVGDATIKGRAADYHSVSGDVGVGDITVDAAGGSGTSQRAVVSDSETWIAESSDGKATIETDIGVGDADITLD
jgi:hypothetical protein